MLHSRIARSLLFAAAAAFAFNTPSIAQPPSKPAPAATPPPSAPVPPALETAKSNQSLRAVVSIPPLEGLVRPILPAGATLDVLVPPGVSEHGFEIPPSKLAALAKADLVVIVGLSLEPQVEKFLKDNPSPARRVVRFEDVLSTLEPRKDDHGNTPPPPPPPPGGSNQAAVPPAPAPKPSHDHHDHDGHSHDHEHEAGGHTGPDPHLWLDPLMAKRLVFAVGMEIAALLPVIEPDAAVTKGETLRHAIRETQERIDKVDQAYEALLSQSKNRTIVTGHDAFGHLAKRYGLEVVAISGLAASEPTPEAIAKATQSVREKRLTAVFAEPQLSQAAAKRIAESTGVQVLTLDPLGDGDWFKMMESNLTALRTALAPSSPPAAKP